MHWARSIGQRKERKKERKKHAGPALERLEKSLKYNKYKCRPVCPMGTALDYNLAKLAELIVFELHGKLQKEQHQ